MNWRDCAEHGRQVHHGMHCVSCAREGKPAPALPPLVESVPLWMKKAIEGIDCTRPRQRKPVVVPTVPKRVGRPRGLKLSTREAVCVKAFAELAGEEMIVTKIAQRMGLSRCTVSNLLNRARNRLGLDSRTELVDWQRSQA